MVNLTGVHEYLQDFQVYVFHLRVSLLEIALDPVHLEIRWKELVSKSNILRANGEYLLAKTVHNVLSMLQQEGLQLLLSLHCIDLAQHTAKILFPEVIERQFSAVDIHLSFVPDGGNTLGLV